MRSARQGWLGAPPLARFFEGRGRQNSYIRSICSAITCVVTSHGSPRLTAVGICSHQRIRASWLPWLVRSYPCHPHDSLAHMRHDTTVSDHDRTRVKEIADARLLQILFLLVVFWQNMGPLMTLDSWGMVFVFALLCRSCMGNCAYEPDSNGHVAIPEGVKEIPDRAFMQCAALKSVSIPSSVIRIGNHAFFGSPRLKSILIPTSVETIGIGAFEDATELETINFAFGSSSLTTIPDKFARSCVELRSVRLPDSVLEINKEAFRTCRKLENVTLGKGLKFLGKEAFAETDNLKSINLPEGLLEIGFTAFRESALQSIVLPSTLEYVNGSVFLDNMDLESVTVNSMSINFGTYNFLRCNRLSSNNCLLYTSPSPRDLSTSRMPSSA